MILPGADRVMVACPDARPPAYQAVVGLARAGLLHSFQTAFYYGGDDSLSALGRRLAPEQFARWQRVLRRRHHPEIPRVRVRSVWSYDVALRLEDRLPRARGRVARWRTRRFDRGLARSLARHPPEAALVFSDVGSEFALPTCRSRGIATLLSMVHGDVREEQLVLEREAEVAPDFFRIYLGDGALDRDELAWLHDRRLRDLELADRILVPSDHIAAALVRHGTDHGKLAVIPYAADTRGFRPDPVKRHDATCTFLFAGGITQRKGIKYLLEAWRRVRRPGWRLQLLGPLPSQPGPLVDYLGEVEHLGRVGARRDARADGVGRRVRLPIAVRRVGCRHLRGAGLRPAERRDPQCRIGRPRRHRGIRGSGRRRRGARRPDGTTGWRCASPRDNVPRRPRSRRVLQLDALSFRPDRCGVRPIVREGLFNEPSPRPLPKQAARVRAHWGGDGDSLTRAVTDHSDALWNCR